MGKPVSVQVGQTISVPFTYDDGSGNPSQEPTALSARSDPAGLVSATVTVKEGGTGSVDILGVAAGSGSLILDGQGTTALSDSVPLGVSAASLPLCGALHLNP